jgi:hypothetical protein
MKKHTKHLPPGWYIEGVHLHSADGHSRCVNFDSGLEYERVSLTLRNYGHEDFAALWDTNAAQLVEVLKAISALAANGTGDICQDIKRRADSAIQFAS